MRMRRLLPVVGAVALGACRVDERQDVFTPEGNNAEKINDLQVPVFITAGVVGVLVFALLGTAILRGIRRHKTDAEDPVQLEGNFKLEIGWTIAPAILLAVIAVFTVATLFDIDTADATDEAIEAMEITVYGQQWWWSYEYDLDPEADNGPEVITANDLVLPTGTPVTVNIESRDVIHSFWIPSLNGTRDAVPGRTHTLVLEADEPGVFDGQCKEFCGLSHANMKQRVLAVEPDAFMTWLDQQQDDQPMLDEGEPGYAGQQLFIQRCTACHQVNGLEDTNGDPILVEGRAGVVALHAPNLTHLMTRGVFAGALFELYVTDDDGRTAVNRTRLEAWLRNPTAEKPMYLPAEGTPRGMPDLGLSEAEIDELIEYLVTLHPRDADRPPIETSSRSGD